MDLVRLENVAEKQAERKPVLMECGCVAHAVSYGTKNKPHDTPIPYCLTHDCATIAPNTPDLAGRKAKCAYFGKGGFRNYGPIYGGGQCDRRTCRCEVPSSLELPFFEFRGVGSPIALETCTCGRIEKLHWPLWQAHFKVIRRWFKIEKYESVHEARKHLPTLTRGSECDWVTLWTEYEKEHLMKMGDGPSLTGDSTEPTKVYSVELVDVKQIESPSGLKICGAFIPAGAAEFDKFFCGCAGWD